MPTLSLCSDASQEGAMMYADRGRMHGMPRFIGLLMFLALAPAGCGRSDLDPDYRDWLGQGGTGSGGTAGTGGTGAEAGVCGPVTCPLGCCDSQGKCVAGSDDSACGTKAGRCSNCTKSTDGAQGVCQSSTRTCVGSCQCERQVRTCVRRNGCNVRERLSERVRVRRRQVRPAVRRNCVELSARLLKFLRVRQWQV